MVLVIRRLPVYREDSHGDETCVLGWCDFNSVSTSVQQCNHKLIVAFKSCLINLKIREWERRVVAANSWPGLLAWPPTHNRNNIINNLWKLKFMLATAWTRSNSYKFCLSLSLWQLWRAADDGISNMVTSHTKNVRKLLLDGFSFIFGSKNWLRHLFLSKPEKENCQKDFRDTQ